MESQSEWEKLGFLFVARLKQGLAALPSLSFGHTGQDYIPVTLSFIQNYFGLFKTIFIDHFKSIDWLTLSVVPEEILQQTCDILTNFRAIILYIISCRTSGNAKQLK